MFYVLFKDVDANDVRELVMDYLLHVCCKETAKSFVADAGLPEIDDRLPDIETRKRKVPCTASSLDMN
jgi:hypothetical protein